MEPITLSQLGRAVSESLDYAFPDEVWVKAEISSMNVRGHCYMELVEKDPSGNSLVAKCNATMWKNVYLIVAPGFERATGMTLCAGLKVLVAVRVRFHELYGYSLNITDIDPTYTLGDLQQQRQMIIDQLTKDGIVDANKELTLPRLVQRIAVISSETAAGYGDFMNQLEQSPYRFVTRLFPSLMQGAGVTEGIVSQLEAIAEEIDNWDCVVIIRGGGAASDLQGFDTLELAENVAQFPLPIITGLGHERDNTVIDLIAHTRCKTPTAVAEFLISLMDGNYSQLDEAANAIARAVQMRLSTERERLVRHTTQLPLIVANRLALSRTHLEGIPNNLRQIVKERFMAEHHKLQLVEERIRLADPALILRRGFSLTLLDGKVVRSADEVAEGIVVTTMLSDGKIESVVKRKVE